MRSFNNENRFWVALGGVTIGLSVLLAAFGRHGLETAEAQMRWGIAVEYLRFMAAGIMGMTVLRCFFFRMQRKPWPERMLATGVAAFSFTLCVECLWPNAAWVEAIGYAAPIGGILMTFSWLAFVFEFIQATGVDAAK